MSTSLPLEGKVALVTGSSRGIGKAVALELASLGADLAITARTDSAVAGSLGSLEEAARQVESLGRRAQRIQADLLDPADVHRLADEVLDAFGGVDILVNNAAYLADDMYATFWDMTEASWRAQIELNVNVPFVLSKRLIPKMVERGGGLVINMTTFAHAEVPIDPESPGSYPLPGQGGVGAAYGASKMALNGMTNALAHELYAFNVALLTINPGFTATENAVLIAERFDFDISMANPMTVPARAVGYLATCDDPMRYSGTRLSAEDLVRDLQLL